LARPPPSQYARKMCHRVGRCLKEGLQLLDKQPETGFALRIFKHLMKI